MLSLSSRAILKRSFLAHRPAARLNATYYASMHNTGDQETAHRYNDPKVLEAEKHKNPASEQRTASIPISEAPGWEEDLATSSEAHVKVGHNWQAFDAVNSQPYTLQADKSGDTTATLVTKTVEHIHARHSPEERLGSREAPYERDAVEGPLRSGTPESRECPSRPHRHREAEDYTR